MKQITANTILKQGNETFVPIVSEGTIFWRDEKRNCVCVAQSQPKLDGVPVISLDSYVEQLCPCTGIDFRAEWTNGYKSNPNQCTQKDIEKAIELARDLHYYTKEGILDQINSISVVEVNDKWEVVSYE